MRTTPTYARSLLRRLRCRATRRALAIVATTLAAAALSACTDRLPTAPANDTAAAPLANVTPQSLAVVQLTSTQDHVCALKSDHAMVCWGRGDFTPFVPVAGTVVYIDGGRSALNEGCAIRGDGSGDCWGMADPTSGTFTRIAAGTGHGCGIRTDQTIDCWGNDFGGSATPPSGTFKRVSSGPANCAIRTNDTMICWGANQGVGLDQAPSGTFLEVSTGWHVNCAIRTNSTLHCWGSDLLTQAPAGTFIAVSSGLRHSCAVDTGFTLHCWGENDRGQSSPPAGQYTQVAAGRAHSCAVDMAAKVVCWGAPIVADHIPPEIAGPRTTTTSLSSTPNPSAFGQNVVFTATVRAGTNAANAGTVTFIEGGTCAAPLFTHASGVALGTGGRATMTTGALTVGTHTIIACYSGASGLFFASEGTAAHTVDPGITLTSVTVSPSTQQYSDRVSLLATVTPSSVHGSSPAGTVQFRIGGIAVGSPVALAGGVATLPNAQVLVGHGNTTVEAVFTSTSSDFRGSTGSASLTVTQEDATVLYDAGNAAALQVSTPGGALNVGGLSLSIRVREQEPDAAVLPGTTGIGSVANAGLSVVLAPVGPGTSYTLVCAAGSVAGSGYQAARPFTCTNPAAIEVNVYEVQVTVTGNHYTGTHTDVFTVFDPSLGFVTGGGTFDLDGDRVRFGINTRYKKKGDDAKGSLMLTRRHADGTTTSLKSNALGGMAVGEDAGVSMGWAALSGRATYTRWDATTGTYVTVGGQSFTFYVEDRGSPGAGTDRAWIGGPAQLSLPGTPATARANAVTLTGGNVSVPHGN